MTHDSLTDAVALITSPENAGFLSGRTCMCEGLRQPADGHVFPQALSGVLLP